MANHTDAPATPVEAGPRYDLPHLRKSGPSDGRCGDTRRGEEPDFQSSADGSAVQVAILSSVVVVVPGSFNDRQQSPAPRDESAATWVRHLVTRTRGATGCSSTKWATDYAGRNPVKGVNGRIKKRRQLRPRILPRVRHRCPHTRRARRHRHPQPRPHPTNPPPQAPRQHHRGSSRTSHPRHHPTRRTNPTHGRSHTHPGTLINQPSPIPHRRNPPVGPDASPPSRQRHQNP